MPVLVELVHAEPGRRVVLARQTTADGVIATALGEGSSAEEAEDRARARLADQPRQQAQPLTKEPEPQPELLPRAERPTASARPKPAPPTPREAPTAPAATTLEEFPQPTAADPEPSPHPSPHPSTDPSTQLPTDPPSEPPSEPPADPEDWSSELAHLDLQLKRLGWTREQEAIYLLRAFGHSSRSRLTTYSDLVAYLRALEGFSAGADPANCSVPLKRSDLLQHSDQLLAQLGWDAARGRELLEAQFKRNSRQQLSDSQLLEFNMLLESELLGGALSNGS